MTHVHQPASFLSSCFDALKPGEALLISTPNCRGFEFVLGEHYEGFQVTGLNFFSIQGLRAVLGRSGFQDIEIRCIGKKDVDIVRSMLKRTPQAIEVLSGFMKDLLLDDSKETEKKRIAFQRFLTEYEFSALMEAVAVKPMN